MFSPEVKGFLFSSAITLIGIFIAWLRLRVKRSNIEADKDQIEVKQGLIAVEAYYSLKKEYEALASLLPKLQEKLDKLKSQVEALQGVEKERDQALSKVEIIESVAQKLTLELHLKTKDGVQLEEKEVEQ